MLPDRVSNPGPLTYESGALPIALRGPARPFRRYVLKKKTLFSRMHFVLQKLLSTSVNTLPTAYFFFRV